MVSSGILASYEYFYHHQSAGFVFSIKKTVLLYCLFDLE